MFRLCLLLALSSAQGQQLVLEQGQGQGQGQGRQLVPIIKSLAEQKNDGSYFFAYEGADGSYREEVGIVRRSDKHMRLAAEDHRNNDRADNDGNNEDDDDAELEVSGVYRYIDSQGQLVEVSYVADKNGFVPLGTNVRQEITEAAQNAAQEPPEPAGKDS